MGGEEFRASTRATLISTSRVSRASTRATLRSATDVSRAGTRATQRSIDETDRTEFSPRIRCARVSGGNKVPVEGIVKASRECEYYCDDEVMVVNEDIHRLCVIHRLLIVWMAMELVMIGYTTVMWDVIQWCNIIPTVVGREARARDDYGAVLDGGVNTARPSSNNGFGPAFYLDNNISNTDRRGELELVSSEDDNDVESRIQDDDDHKPCWLDLSRDHSQK